LLNWQVIFGNMMRFVGYLFQLIELI